MTRARKRRRAESDPLLRACTACGAGVGVGCRIVDDESKPLIPRATRLVHAARLEQGASDA